MVTEQGKSNSNTNDFYDNIAVLTNIADININDVASSFDKNAFVFPFTSFFFF